MRGSCAGVGSCRLRTAAAFLAAAALALGSCATGPALRASREAIGNDYDGRSLFTAPDNPFHEKVPADAPVHPDSAAMVALLREACTEAGNPEPTNTYVAVREWNIPVYLAGPEARRKDVRIWLYNMPEGKKWLRDVPVIPGAKPSPGTDRTFTVIDTASRRLFEFWIYDGWRAASGNVIGLDSTGIYADGRSTVAAGWSAVQGIIWPKELREGRIEHALSFTCPVTDADGFVAPATHNDGALTGNPLAIPEGALLRIRPDVDIDALPDIGMMERIIYRAIQEYGMYCSDTNGAGLGLRALAAQSVDAEAWPPGFDFDTRYGSYVMRNFPFDQLEVMDSGPLSRNPEPPPPYVDHGGASWR